MENIAMILVLIAMIGFFTGLVGIIKGNVKFLKLKTRKASGIFTGGMVVLFFVSMITFGATYEPPPENNTAGEKVEQQPDSEGKTDSVNDTNEIKEEETAEEAKIEEENSEQNVMEENDESIESEEITPPVTLNGELEVHFVDVGQGAAQVIITPNKKVMLIDGGNNDDEGRIVSYLNDLGVKKVDILIGTHPDADHIGGIDAVIDTFDIGKIYMPKVERDTQTFESVLLSIQNKGLKVTTAKAGLTLDLDTNVNVKMIAPIGTDSDANEMSAVVRLVYGNHSFLLTGDAGHSSEQKLINSGETLKSTVLLVGHHGSDYSTSQAFLNAVKPVYSVIQVGKNSYGHPTPEVLSRLNNAGSKIYRNDTDGTIVFTTNGSNIEVNKKAWVYQNQSSTPKSEPKEVPKKETKTETGSSTGTTSGPLKVTASIDNSQPSQNEHVTVTVTVKDGNNKPVNGANVKLTLHFKSKDTIYEEKTNANGVAAFNFSIGRASSGFTVEGALSVTANGQTATTTTAFTPQ